MTEVSNKYPEWNPPSKGVGEPEVWRSLVEKPPEKTELEGNLDRDEDHEKGSD